MAHPSPIDTQHKTSEFVLKPIEEIRRKPSLTVQPIPTGWAGDTSGVVSRSERTDKAADKARLRMPKLPQGIRKLMRYAWGVVTMLRRPIVMHDFPIHMQLESTDACNLNCTTCSRDVIVDKASILPEEHWKTVIDEMKPTTLNVSGIGEPFLHPDIFRIIEFAKSRGAAVNCATNFTRISGRHREVVESGIDQLKVSIDATDAETYRLIRGEHLWDHIVENIKELNEWKKKLGSTKPSIRFNFALQRFNYEQAVDLVELARELGVDGIYYQFLSYVDMEDRKPMLTGDMSRTRLLELLDEAGKRAEKYGIKTNLDLWERDFEWFWNKMHTIEDYKPNGKNCYMPWISTWLGADGWVRPCPVMPWTVDEGRMGNLREQTFAEIWNGKPYRDLREALKRGERPTRSCKTCYPQDLYNVMSIKSKLLP
jgi:radical SAM protein with 4Fe4S-binding SPASM domain